MPSPCSTETAPDAGQLDRQRSRVSVWWLLALLWAAEMFSMSTGVFSGDLTRPLLARLLDLLRLDLSAAAFGVLHTVLRK